MLTTTTNTDLLSRIRNASPRSRQFVLQSLINEFIEETNFAPLPITNAEGTFVGTFYPDQQRKLGPPSTMTSAEAAEVLRRLKTPEDSVTLEEFIKLLDAEIVRLRAERPVTPS